MVRNVTCYKASISVAQSARGNEHKHAQVTSILEHGVSLPSAANVTLHTPVKTQFKKNTCYFYTSFWHLPSQRWFTTEIWTLLKNEKLVSDGCVVHLYCMLLLWINLEQACSVQSSCLAIFQERLPDHLGTSIYIIQMNTFCVRK